MISKEDLKDLFDRAKELAFEVCKVNPGDLDITDGYFDNITINDDLTINVNWSRYWCGTEDYNSCTFTLEELYNPEQFLKDLKEELEVEKIKKEQDRLQKAAEAAMTAEMKERAEYEKLKRKYGN